MQTVSSPVWDRAASRYDLVQFRTVHCLPLSRKSITSCHVDASPYTFGTLL